MSSLVVEFRLGFSLEKPEIHEVSRNFTTGSRAGEEINLFFRFHCDSSGVVDDVRTYWMTTKERFFIPSLSMEGTVVEGRR